MYKYLLTIYWTKQSKIS